MIGLYDIAKMLQINFLRESGCNNVNVRADSVDKIIIKDGFLMVHDEHECCWHCYNINHIEHFHYPDYVRGLAK